MPPLIEVDGTFAYKIVYKKVYIDALTNGDLYLKERYGRVSFPAVLQSYALVFYKARLVKSVKGAVAAGQVDAGSSWPRPSKDSGAVYLYVIGVVCMQIYGTPSML